MRTRRMTAALAGVLLGGIVLSACGGGASDTGRETSQASSPAAGSSNRSAGPADGGADRTAAADGDTCATADLAFGYGPDSGAQSPDSPGAVVVKLTNRGASDCVMNGFPGVDLHTDHGVLTVPRTKQTPRQVTLEPGGSTLFDILYMPSDPGSSTGTKVSTMVITPPNETHSHSMPWEYQSILVTNGEGSLDAYPAVGPVGTDS